MSDKDNGSFLGGFTIGMFAGAIGYFLFATKDGDKLRKKIEEEWHGAKEVLAEEGVIENKDTTIPDMIRNWLNIEKNTPKSSTNTKKKKTKPKSKVTKFKGT